MRKLIKEKVSMDPIWDKVHLGGWGKYPSESLVRFLCRYRKSELNFQRKNRILDFGCGGGANTRMMLAEDFDVYAVDGSKEAVRCAKRFVDSSKVKFTTIDFLMVRDIFPKNYFDIVCDDVSIYSNSITNIDKILLVVFEIMKKGGLFYSSCFSTKTLGFGLGEKLESGTYRNINRGSFKNRGVAHFYTEKELRRVYEKYFKVESLDTEEYTDFNRKNRISKFILICRKK